MCFTNNMRIMNIAKTIALTTALTAIPATIKTNNNRFITNPQTTEQVDSFIPQITPQGTKNLAILAQAPKPDVTIARVKKKAGIVVDLKKNILYRYDKDGKPVNAYLIASGAVDSPTNTGVRIVSHIETYPYKTAKGTKRSQNPNDYGPKILILKIVDPKTGKQSYTGEFIHGHLSYYDTFEATKDRRVSHGCMRMDNDVIQTLAKEVKPGELVIIDYFD